MPANGNAIELKPGDRFGSWTVIRKAVEADPVSQAQLWWVKCVCFRTTIVRGDVLRRGKSTKCKSCSNRERRRTIKPIS